ncbi:MAG: hypothetical protein HYX63_13330 [Gammaproteobacteria bacterium]|nr:hypothetical protein [Gammaproteobacteria bacterium]
MGSINGLRLTTASLCGKLALVFFLAAFAGSQHTHQFTYAFVGFALAWVFVRPYGWLAACIGIANS